MSKPFLLAQISDTHIGGTFAGGDPVAALARAVRELRGPDRPDAVLVTGDVADTGEREQVRVAGELLAELGGPVYPLPGNHDSRAALRSQFSLPGSGDEPIQYAVSLGPLRLVAMDTTIPGDVPGQLDAARLAWLDAELARAPAQPTLLAMHHPPFATGVPAWDRIGIDPDDREALAEVLARNRQVRRIVAGHVHMTIAGQVGGCVALTAPATYGQSRLSFEGGIELVSGPPGFAVHVLTDGEIVSFARQLDG